MTSATPSRALHDAGLAFDSAATADARTRGEAPAALQLSLHTGFDAIEAQWRAFERVADCLPFQTFAWLQTWHRHIGQRDAAQPMIAVASYMDGATACILPLAIERKWGGRRLCWLGQDLNDYNAPLLARDFSQRVPPGQFLATWNELRARLQSDPMLRHDWIELEKMPQWVAGQPNPFFDLALSTHPSGAHFALLGDDWKEYYAARRSSATRRRDRAKRKHLTEFGEVRYVTCAASADARCTLETLMVQKHRLFVDKGIPDLFARTGWREFFLDISANPATRDLVHVSRVQVGDICAAANLGVIFRDSYYHVLASYDDGPVAHYGPGTLHLRELLAYAIERGLRRFDFTIGDEPYKLEWADTRVRLGDYAAAATWRGGPAYTLSMLWRSAKRFVKQTPWLWRAACRLRAHLGPLRRRLPHPGRRAPI